MLLPGGCQTKVVENAESGEKVLDFYVQIDVRNGLFLCKTMFVR